MGARRICLYSYERGKVKKKYPKWFHYYSQPSLRQEPQPPSKQLNIEKIVKTYYDWDHITKDQLIAEDFEFARVERDSPYEDSNEILNLYKIEIKDKKPLTYKREYNAYLKDKEKWLAEKIEHELKLAEWNKIRYEMDEDNRIKAEKQERALLKKLKEKYND